MQPGLDPRRLVFVDETWASTNMTPRYGRCEKGKRLIAHAPFGHWKTTTSLAGLRCDGVTAPCVFDGPINGEKFLAYVEQVLAPTLSPGAGFDSKRLISVRELHRWLAPVGCVTVMREDEGGDGARPARPWVKSDERRTTRDDGENKDLQQSLNDLRTHSVKFARSGCAVNPQWP